MRLDPPTPTAAYRPPYRRGLVTRADDYWPELGVRIAVAGGFFPVILLVGWGGLGGALMLAHQLAFGPNRLDPDLPLFLIGSLLGTPVVWGVGFVYAGLVATFTLPAVALTLRLLGERPPADATGVFAGSVVAVLSTLPISLLATTNIRNGDTDSGVVEFLHVLLAIALGQAAGCLAGVSDLRRRHRGTVRRARFRLTVWRLLAAMIPLSIVLSLLSLGDLMRPMTGLVAASSVGGALLTYRPVSWLVNRWLDRRLRRRRARRLAMTGAQRRAR